MSASGLLQGLGLGSQLLGGILGGRKRRKASEALARRQAMARGELKSAGEANLSSLRDTFRGAFEQISNLPQLEISTNQIDQSFSDAQRNLEFQYGRSLGEEQARDSVRESTADLLGRARNIGGSTLDLLGFAAESTDRERVAFRDIDIASINARESRINQAMNRLQSVGLSRADFIRNKELSEYQDQFNRQQMLANLGIESGTTLSEVEYQNAINLINADNQTAQARANVDLIKAQNIENTLSTLGQGLTSIGSGMESNSNYASLLMGLG